MKEITLRLTRNHTSKYTLNLVHDQLGHRINTRRTVDIAGLCGEVLAS